MNTPNSTPDYIEIPTTRGLHTIVDVIDSDLANHKWMARLTKSRGTNHYTIARNVWIVGSKRHSPQKVVYMARLILGRILGRELAKGEFVDHKDNNPLNNRRSNLRLSDYWTNNRSAKRRVDNKSGYKGVCWDEKSKKWRAYINIDKKRINLGVWPTPELAYTAYCEAAKKYHGEFANFG